MFGLKKNKDSDVWFSVAEAKRLIQKKSSVYVHLHGLLSAVQPQSLATPSAPLHFFHLCQDLAVAIADEYRNSQPKLQSLTLYSAAGDLWTHELSDQFVQMFCRALQTHPTISEIQFGLSALVPSDRAFFALAELLSRQKNLKKLVIYFGRIEVSPRAFHEFLQELVRHPRLKDVSIGVVLNDEHLRLLLRSFYEEKAESVKDNVSNNELDGPSPSPNSIVIDNLFQRWAPPDATSIESLDISLSVREAISMAPLARFLQQPSLPHCPNLKTLSLVGNLSLDFELLAAALEQNTFLKTLNLFCSVTASFSLPQLQAFSRALCANPTLTSLTLDSMVYSYQADYDYDAKDSDARAVPHVDSSQRAFFQLLADVLTHNTSLLQLQSRYNSLRGVGDVAEGRALLGALAQNRTLKSLSLCSSQLGNTGLEALVPALRSNRAITKLDLSQNGIETRGWSFVASILSQSPQLLEFVCNDQNEFSWETGKNPEREAALRALGVAIRDHPQLKKLGLRSMIRHGDAEELLPIAQAILTNRGIVRVEVDIGERVGKLTNLALIECLQQRPDIMDQALIEEVRFSDLDCAQALSSFHGTQSSVFAFSSSLSGGSDDSDSEPTDLSITCCSLIILLLRGVFFACCLPFVVILSLLRYISALGSSPFIYGNTRSQRRKAFTMVFLDSTLWSGDQQSMASGVVDAFAIVFAFLLVAFPLWLSFVAVGGDQRLVAWSSLVHMACVLLFMIVGIVLASRVRTFRTSGSRSRQPRWTRYTSIALFAIILDFFQMSALAFSKRPFQSSHVVNTVFSYSIVDLGSSTAHIAALITCCCFVCTWLLVCGLTIYASRPAVRQTENPFLQRKLVRWNTTLCLISHALFMTIVSVFMRWLGCSNPSDYSSSLIDIFSLWSAECWAGAHHYIGVAVLLLFLYYSFSMLFVSVLFLDHPTSHCLRYPFLYHMLCVIPKLAAVMVSVLFSAHAMASFTVLFCSNAVLLICDLYFSTTSREINTGIARVICRCLTAWSIVASWGNQSVTVFQLGLGWICITVCGLLVVLLRNICQNEPDSAAPVDKNEVETRDSKEIPLLEAR